jgi:cell wall-associated NlpC family hydrolase
MDTKVGIKEQKQAVLAEAKLWLDTPFHHGARLKSIGTDCGQLLLGVYENAGIIPHVETPFYSPDFFFHNSDPWFENIVREFCQEIDGPGPADVCLFKFGRVYSHGTIVVDWPLVIHAFHSIGRVAFGSALLKPCHGREHKFFRPKVWC